MMGLPGKTLICSTLNLTYLRVRAPAPAAFFRHTGGVGRSIAGAAPSTMRVWGRRIRILGWDGSPACILLEGTAKMVLVAGSFMEEGLEILMVLQWLGLRVRLR